MLTEIQDVKFDMLYQSGCTFSWHSGCLRNEDYPFFESRWYIYQ